MREINLTRGQTALVDDEDFVWLTQWKWHANLQRGNFYASRTSAKIMMHDEILKWHALYIRFRGLVVDHVDRDSLNNCKINLRQVTPAENALNHSRPHNGISYRGSQFKYPWRLRIRTGPYTRRHIGVFATHLEAEEALHDYTHR